MVTNIFPKIQIIFLFLFSASISGSNFQLESKLILNLKTDDRIVIKKINGSQIKNLIKQRNGKILLLNIWATWCIPCREELPDLNKLQNHYSNDDVDIVTISVDYPDEIEEKVLPFLKSVNANFPAYVAEISNDTELINILNTNWNGSLPATFIYNKNGTQASTLLGNNSFDEFVKAIEIIK